MEDKLDEQPIVWLTHFVTTVSMPKRGKKDDSDAGHWRVYGVDAQGIERVYGEFNSDEEFKA